MLHELPAPLTRREADELVRHHVLRLVSRNGALYASFSSPAARTQASATLREIRMGRYRQANPQK